MLEARLDKIPNFITADTPMGLRQAMLRNNVRRATQFIYHDIQFVNGKWFAWFYEETNLKELERGNSETGQARSSST